MWWGRRGDHEIDGGHGDGARQGVWCLGQMGGGQGCLHVYNVLKCVMLETTWRRTLKVTLEKVLSNADVVQGFSYAGRVWRLTWSVYTEERLSACDLCAKRFSSGNSLKKHMKAQAGGRPYECRHWICCDKHFYQNHSLEDWALKTELFHSGEKYNGGEKPMWIYMSASKLSLKLFGCVLDEGPSS